MGGKTWKFVKNLFQDFAEPVMEVRQSAVNMLQKLEVSAWKVWTVLIKDACIMVHVRFTKKHISM